MTLLSQSPQAAVSVPQQYLPPRTTAFYSSLTSPSGISAQVPSSRLILPSPQKSQVDSPIATSSHPVGHDFQLGFNLRPDQQDAHLSLFRSQMAHNFPFVIILPDISARILRSQKPFLFGTMMLAVTRGKISDQKPMRETLMEYLSIHILVNSEKSIDLLQGILVYIAWFVCVPQVISISLEH